MGPRGRAGKFSKPTRGGGKKFSREVQPVDGMWRDPDDIPSEEDSEDDSEEDSEESSEDDGTQQPEQEMTREQRRAAAKARKEAALAKKRQVAAQPGDLPPTDSEDEDDSDDDGEDLPANPNHTAKSRSQAAKPPAALAENGGEDAKQKKNVAELSRREREAIQAQQAKERYMKLHMEGKTDEARADLERLRLVRERREAEKAQREAEREEREAREKEKAEARSEREEKLRQAALGKTARGGSAKKGGKR